MKKIIFSFLFIKATILAVSDAKTNLEPKSDVILTTVEQVIIAE